MNLNASNELPPSSSTMRPQGPHSGRRSLPPANVIGSHHVLPSYPSSTLQYYYPLSQYPVTRSHIFSPFQPIHGQPTVVEHPVQTLLPSASQSHVPSIRRTPSSSPFENIRIQSISPALTQRTAAHIHDNQCIHSLSPIAFYQPQPMHAFPAPQTLPLHNAQHLNLPLLHLHLLLYPNQSHCPLTLLFLNTYR